MSFAHLTLGMEEFTQGEGTEATVPAVQAQVDADAAQLTQGATEIESAQIAVEEAIAQGEVLGQVQDTLQASVDSGEGVSPEAAQVAEIAVEGICSMLRLPRTSRMATEHFGSANGRIAATKLAIESISDSIKALFERIKAIAIRIWEKIKSFVLGLFKSTDGMSKHLESLKQRVVNLDDTLKADGDLENEAIAKAVSVAKKADAGSIKVILENSTNLLAGSETISGGVNFGVDVVTDLVKKSDVSARDLATASSKISDKVGTAIDNAMNRIKGFNQGAAIKEDKKAKVKYYGPFAGCRVFAVKDEEKDLGGEKFRMYSINVTTLDKIAAAKAKTLTKSEMVEVIAAASTLLDSLSSYKKAQDKLASINANIKSATDTAMSSLNKAAGDDTEKQRVYRKVATELNSFNAICSSIGVSVPKTVYDGVKAAADYVSASIANYKKK